MNDKQLSATELKIKYVLQHPKYTIDNWRGVVEQCSTILGYWNWVVFQLEREPSKYTITITLESTGVFDDLTAKRLLSAAIEGNSVFTGVYSIAIND